MLTIKRNWTLHPSSSTYTFPSSSTSTANGLASSADAAAQGESTGEGVTKGVPMQTMVGPALRLAQQLEAIV